MFKINLSRRSGAEPLTLQLATSLTQQIKTGKIKKGDNLPSERELAIKTGVARNVVRNAYEQLEKGGLIKNHGRDGRTVVKVPRR